MRQPDELRTDRLLKWSVGRGEEVWRLLSASAAGRLEEVREILEADRRLVRCQHAYRTPIYFAVRENRVEVATLLLEWGADPLSLAVGDSLVEVARVRGFREMEARLRRALDEKFNASGAGEPVAAAIRDRDGGRVQSLLEEAPELLTKGDARGNQAIHWAVMTRQPGMIDELLARGADPNARRFDGARPIHLTNGDYHYRGWRDVPATVEATPEAVYAHLVNRGATVDLGMAAFKGDFARVRELVEANPGLVNQVSEYGSYYPGCGSPLKNAAVSGQLEIVRYLLEHGAAPNLPEEGIAPNGHALYAAVAHGHLEIVRLLLSHGASPNAEVESSADALSRAIDRGDRAMVALLCRHGATRPMHLLAHANDLTTAAAVMAANPAYADDPEALASAASEDFVRLLLRYQPRLPERIAVAKDPETTELLFAHGMDANWTDWLGSTPLHHAARRGELEGVALFLRHGADPNARDEDSWCSALALAAWHGHLALVEFLLRHGARIRLPDDPPWATPLACAERHGHDKIAAILRHQAKWGMPAPGQDRAVHDALVAASQAAERAIIDADELAFEKVRQANPEAFGEASGPPYVPSGPAPRYTGDARTILLREHGFETWAEFEAFRTAWRETGSPTALFEEAVDAVVEGAEERLTEILRRWPEVVQHRSRRKHGATLLHYVGANGVEGFRQRTPPNAVRIAELLVSSGADPNVSAGMYGGATVLGLVATSIHPCLAGVQLELLRCLIERGAVIDDPRAGGNGQSAVPACLANGRQEAAEFLASAGAVLDLEGAAGVGDLRRVKECFGADGRLVGGSTEAQAYAGFQWACEYGRAEVVAFLLGVGLDPNRMHRGQTALHWAAFGGHGAIVEMLLRRGASVDREDESWGQTPLGWAVHGWLYPPLVACLADYPPVVGRLVAAGSPVRPEWREDRRLIGDRRMRSALLGTPSGAGSRSPST